MQNLKLNKTALVGILIIFVLFSARMFYLLAKLTKQVNQLQNQ